MNEDQKRPRLRNLQEAALLQQSVVDLGRDGAGKDGVRPKSLYKRRTVARAVNRLSGWVRNIEEQKSMVEYRSGIGRFVMMWLCAKQQQGSGGVAGEVET